MPRSRPQAGLQHPSEHGLTVPKAFSRRYIRATPPLAVTIVFPDYARPSQHTHFPKDAPTNMSISVPPLDVNGASGSLPAVAAEPG